jgi:hypothetical protein
VRIPPTGGSLIPRLGITRRTVLDSLLEMVMKLLASFVIGCISASLMLGASFEFYPGASYDPAIPTLEAVVGHGWGEEITDHRQMEIYIRALEQSSARVRVIRYGETWEKRSLYYLVIGSPENLARIDSIKRGLWKLANPDQAEASELEALARSLPAVAWLSYSVHGNEISGTEAALLTAYHLLAARKDPLVEKTQAETLVIIDPLQNPDGRARFISYFEQTRGRWPDPNQAAAEHNETWPGGRSNHYLFDMNRDWFALTQPETVARVKAFLEWFPQVFVDLHEMGSDSTYYFPPPAPPNNPELSGSHTEWHGVFGRNNAAWFDKRGFDYFTREVFDSFYPGYGEGWPMFHGAVGMTYEQATTRGLVVKRKDETVMHYRDTVQRHFIASLATVETTAENREALLRHFLQVRKAGIDDGARNQTKGFLIDGGRDRVRVEKLIRNLMLQGVRVQRTTQRGSAKARDYYEHQARAREFPAGSYYVPLAQPARPLVATLLGKETPMQSEFVQEQQRRYKKRLRDEIYDITAWSLPLLYDVECFMLEEVPGGVLETLMAPPETKGRIEGGRASLAYLVPWGTNAAARSLSHLLRGGIRVYSSDKAFLQKGVTFPAGTLVVKVKDNPPDLHETLSRIADETGVMVLSTDTGWVESGVNLGSSEVRYLKKPNVALAYNLPVSSTSAGALWYLLEQVYDYPVTLIHTRQLSAVDLRDFSVLILPDAHGSGGFGAVLGEEGARRIKEWVSVGGTLVTLGEATRWLTDEKVALLATTREYRGGTAELDPEGSSKEAAPKGQAPATGANIEKKAFDLEKAIEPEKELPGATPGAILRVRVDNEHWLAFGYDTDANVLVSSRNIFTPLKLDKGRNVALYMPEDQLLVSGFSWADARNQLAEKAYLMHQRLGRGHVVAFAEDPNLRAFCDGLNLMLLNAVFFGPAH